MPLVPSSLSLLVAMASNLMAMAPRVRYFLLEESDETCKHPQGWKATNTKNAPRISRATNEALQTHSLPSLLSFAVCCSDINSDFLQFAGILKVIQTSWHQHHQVVCLSYASQAFIPVRMLFLFRTHRLGVVSGVPRSFHGTLAHGA